MDYFAKKRFEEQASPYVVYLVFTSFDHGMHSNVVSNTLKDVITELEAIYPETNEDEEDWETFEYPAQKELEKALDRAEADYTVEFPNSTWTTITRVHLTPLDIMKGDKVL